MAARQHRGGTNEKAEQAAFDLSSSPRSDFSHRPDASAVPPCRRVLASWRWVKPAPVDAGHLLRWLDTDLDGLIPSALEVGGELGLRLGRLAACRRPKAWSVESC